jgi:hypothetical protein
MLDSAPWATCTSPQNYSNLAAGSHTFTVRATDRVGNVDLTPERFNWTINRSYTFSGFFWPLVNPPAINQFKAGTIVPVSFSLGGNMGSNIFAPGYPLSQSVPCGAFPATSVAADKELRSEIGILIYDPFARRYLYLWQTQRAWEGTCRQFVVKFNDGSPVRVVNFRFVR